MAKRAVSNWFARARFRRIVDFDSAADRRSQENASDLGPGDHLHPAPATAMATASTCPCSRTGGWTDLDHRLGAGSAGSAFGVPVSEG